MRASIQTNLVSLNEGENDSVVAEIIPDISVISTHTLYEFHAMKIFITKFKLWSFYKYKMG